MRRIVRIVLVKGVTTLRNSDQWISGKTFNLKVAALERLETANRRYATQVKQRLDLAGKPSPLLAVLNRGTIAALIRAYAEELAETIGGKHGFKIRRRVQLSRAGRSYPAARSREGKTDRVALTLARHMRRHACEARVKCAAIV